MSFLSPYFLTVSNLKATMLSFATEGIGAVIGFFVTKVGLSPFITTLAMMGIALLAIINTSMILLDVSVY